MNELLHKTQAAHAVPLPKHHAQRIAVQQGAIIVAGRHDSRGVDEASSLLILTCFAVTEDV